MRMVTAIVYSVSHTGIHVGSYIIAVGSFSLNLQILLFTYTDNAYINLTNIVDDGNA